MTAAPTLDELRALRDAAERRYMAAHEYWRAVRFKPWEIQGPAELERMQCQALYFAACNAVDRAERPQQSRAAFYADRAPYPVYTGD